MVSGQGPTILQFGSIFGSAPTISSTKEVREAE